MKICQLIGPNFFDYLKHKLGTQLTAVNESVVYFASVPKNFALALLLLNLVIGKNYDGFCREIFSGD